MAARKREARWPAKDRWHRTSGFDWVWRPTRLAIYARDGDACLRCGKAPPDAVLSLDHVVDGRGHGPGNLATLCMGCNAERGAAPIEEFDPALAAVVRAQLAKPIDRALGRRLALARWPGWRGFTRTKVKSTLPYEPGGVRLLDPLQHGGMSEEKKRRSRSQAKLDAAVDKTFDIDKVKPLSAGEKKALDGARKELEDAGVAFIGTEPTSSKKAKPLSAKDATRAADALFGKADASKLLSGGLPELSKPLAAMVETTFAVDDPEALYAALGEALDRNDALTPGALREQLSQAAGLFRDAHRLYIVARADFERFEADFAVVDAAFRDAATSELQKEKETGLRTKQITDGDVRSRVADMFPDHWREMNDRRVRGDKTVEHLRHLVDVFKVRAFALRTLCGSREEL